MLVLPFAASSIDSKKNEPINPRVNWNGQAFTSKIFSRILIYLRHITRASILGWLYTYHEIA